MLVILLAASERTLRGEGCYVITHSHGAVHTAAT